MVNFTVGNLHFTLKKKQWNRVVRGNGINSGLRVDELGSAGRRDGRWPCEFCVPFPWVLFFMVLLLLFILHQGKHQAGPSSPAVDSFLGPCQQHGPLLRVDSLWPEAPCLLTTPWGHRSFTLNYKGHRLPPEERVWVRRSCRYFKGSNTISVHPLQIPSRNTAFKNWNLGPGFPWGLWVHLFWLQHSHLEKDDKGVRAFLAPPSCPRPEPCSWHAFRCPSNWCHQLCMPGSLGGWVLLQGTWQGAAVKHSRAHGGRVGTLGLPLDCDLGWKA